MPPEYIKHGKFSIRSDVFSFGVLVLEIVSGRTRSFRNGEDFEDLINYVGVYTVVGAAVLFVFLFVKEQ